MKNIILILIILIAVNGYSAEFQKDAGDALIEAQRKALAEQQTMTAGTNQVLTNTSCDDYLSCYELFRYEETPSLIRLFYAKNAKVNKFNIMNDYIVKIQDAGCPIKFDVYKKVNNINVLLDTFNYTSYNDACVTYITNLTGSGINSKNVVSQLEIKYCPKDSSHRNFCEKGIVFAKVIGFDNEDLDEEQKIDSLDTDLATSSPASVYPERNQYLNSITEIAPEEVEKEIDKQRRSIGGYTPINNKPEPETKTKVRR